MKTQRIASVAFLALGLAIARQNAHATFLRGQPYTPSGADFSMFAVQGVDASHPNGVSGVSPQVNGDFEFQNSIGVSYDTGSGNLTDFGIGLFNNSANQVQSTGLNIRYNQLVNAASVTVTLEDFDIGTKDTFFNPNKVEPSILLFGPGGTVFASLTPQNIFPYLVANTTAGDKKADVWDLNFGAVLTGMHLASGPITGFTLFADQTAGERPNSDPYLLVAVGNGIPQVPEPANYLAGIAAIVMLGLSQLTVLRRKRAAA